MQWSPRNRTDDNDDDDDEDEDKNSDDDDDARPSRTNVDECDEIDVGGVDVGQLRLSCIQTDYNCSNLFAE